MNKTRRYLKYLFTNISTMFDEMLTVIINFFLNKKRVLYFNKNYYQFTLKKINMQLFSQSSSDCWGVNTSTVSGWLTKTFVYSLYIYLQLKKLKNKKKYFFFNTKNVFLFKQKKIDLCFLLISCDWTLVLSTSHQTLLKCL